jgi:predicted dienelactone hydrolase
MRTFTLVVLLAVAVPASAKCTLDDLLKPGRYGVGHRQLNLVDPTRGTAAWAGRPASTSRTLPTEVWYPIADASGGLAPVEGADLASGAKFPFVVNSPGLGDAGPGAAYVGVALASRGYVVASPTFPLTNTAFLVDPQGPYLQDVQNMPQDVTFIMNQLIALSTMPNAWLSGGIDTKKIGVSGLSLGGLNTLLVTYHPTLRDPRVKAAAAMAPASCWLSETFYETVKPPLLLIDGDQDLITPIETNAVRTFERSRSPRHLVTLTHATHTAFSGFIGGSASAASYDTIACPLLEAKITQQQVDDTIAGFGAPSLTDAAGCALPCLTPPPANPPMSADRQHDLTQAAIVAFFESSFRHSKEGACFLARGLAKEEDAAVAKGKTKKLPRRKHG